MHQVRVWQSEMCVMGISCRGISVVHNKQKMPPPFMASQTVTALGSGNIFRHLEHNKELGYLFAQKLAATKMFIVAQKQCLFAPSEAEITAMKGWLYLTGTNGEMVEAWRKEHNPMEEKKDFHLS